ncbi:MAG TPA: hypothetical protein VM327_00185 [Candidatus Thermoplasmatota archaeon]|nr:hypothetical protein [Candidatus Thermoplasmatota archaeon]
METNAKLWLTAGLTLAVSLLGFVIGKWFGDFARIGIVVVAIVVCLVVAFVKREAA